MESKRIEYIDLMKGICIVLIILMHCDIKSSNERLNDMLADFRVPLYFFLSGLFFKEYDGFIDFCIRKINKLVIPFVFFAYIPYIIYDIMLFYDHTVLSYFFMMVEPFNGPIWFLRCLFFANILYYFYYKYVCNKKTVIQILVMIGITFPIWLLSFKLSVPDNKYLLMFYPIFRDFISAIMALPFIFIASTLRKKGILILQISPKKLVFLFSLFLTVWFFTYQTNISYVFNHFGCNYLFLYTSALGGIGCVWCAAYTFKCLFFFSYIGRYSLIALGTHWTFIRLLELYKVENYLMALCVLAVMPGVIWLFKKYFPYFTAQKDLLVYDNGSVRWAWKKRD